MSGIFFCYNVAMKSVKLTLVSVGLVGYMFLAIFGILAMEHLHQHSMGAMNNCPFMVGQQSLCTMNFTEHIVSWQNLMTSTVGKLILLAIPLFFASFFILLRPPNFARSRLYTKSYRESFISSLFSQGILHSKAP